MYPADKYMPRFATTPPITDTTKFVPLPNSLGNNSNLPTSMLGNDNTSHPNQTGNMTQSGNQMSQFGNQMTQSGNQMSQFGNQMTQSDHMPSLNQTSGSSPFMGWIPVFFTTSMVSGMPTPMPAPFEENIFSYNIPKNLNRPNNEAMMELLRNFDLDLDENIDLARNCPKEIDLVYSDLERNNSGIFSILEAYNVPYPMLKLLIRRVIKHCFQFCDKGGY